MFLGALKQEKKAKFNCLVMFKGVVGQRHLLIYGTHIHIQTHTHKENRENGGVNSNGKLYLAFKRQAQQTWGTRTNYTGVFDL